MRQDHPLVKVETCDRGALQMVVFQHRHFFIDADRAQPGLEGELWM
jgi:hypothetical protein